MTGNVLVDLGDLFTNTGNATGAQALEMLGRMLRSISVDQVPQETKKQ